MTSAQFREGRLRARMTQAEAARRLGISQPYLSQLESSQRSLTPELMRLATTTFRLPPTVLPVPQAVSPMATSPSLLARQLCSLGYPGFAHLRARSKTNPAVVVLDALLQGDLDVRISEALPWVLLRYPDLNWPWLIRHSKLHDAQNRLGFLVALARSLASRRPELKQAEGQLALVEQQLERARLARQDTLCRESMPAAERRWVERNRSALARHWNLLTTLSENDLSYAA